MVEGSAYLCTSSRFRVDFARRLREGEIEGLLMDSLLDWIYQLTWSDGSPKVIVPLFIIVGSLLLGFVFERVVLKWLLYKTSQNAWYSDEIIIGSLRYIVTVWFGLFGTYIAFASDSLYFFGAQGDQRVWSFFPTLLVITLVVTIAIVLTKLAAGFINLYTSQVRGLPSASLLINVAGVIIFLIAALVALQSLGIAITPLLTALGVTGLAVALALQETLANFFAGIVMIVSRQLRVNDYIMLNSGEEGYVTDITWRNTVIRSLEDNIILVPNSTMSSSIITNSYLPNRELSLILTAGVSYESNLDHVEEVTFEVAQEVANEVPGCIMDTEPLVRYNNFSDWGIEFSVILRVREFVDQFLIKHEFMRRLHRRYQEENIAMTSTVQLLRFDRSSGEPSGNDTVSDNGV